MDFLRSICKKNGFRLLLRFQKNQKKKNPLIASINDRMTLHRRSILGTFAVAVLFVANVLDAFAVLFCADVMMCADFTRWEDISVCLTVTVDASNPYLLGVNATATKASGCPLGVANTNLSSSSLNESEASPMYVVVAVTSSPGASSSALLFAMLAGIERSENILRRNASVLFTPPVLADAASDVATQRRLPFLIVQYDPLPSIVTGNVEQKAAQLLSHKAIVGRITYSMSHVAFMIGALAAELSETGVIALLTGPVREPSATIHAYARESIAARCSACVVRSVYLEPSIMANARALYNILQASSLADVDLFLLDVSSVTLQQLVTLSAGGKRFLCVSCRSGIVDTVFGGGPISSSYAYALAAAATPNFGLTKVAEVFEVEVSLPAANGLSMTLCADHCLPPRVERAYADTMTLLQAQYELRGSRSMSAILQLPLLRNVATPTALPTVELLDRDSVVRTSLPPIAAISSNCFAVTVDAAMSDVDLHPECSTVFIARQLERFVVLGNGLWDWTLQPQSPIFSAGVKAASLPHAGFSVTAINRNQFVVFGGELATTELPIPQGTLYMVSFRGSVEASAPVIRLLAPSPLNAAAPSNRSFHAHAVLRRDGDGVRLLYIHGGKGSDGVVLGDFWKFNLIDLTWHRIVSVLEEARYGHTMLYLPRMFDPVLVLIGGSALFPLSTMQLFSLNRTTWSAPVLLDTSPSHCAVALPPLRIGFLSANEMKPCVLDAFTNQVRCNANESGLSVSFDESSHCVEVSATTTRGQLIGMVMVAANALDNRGTALVSFQLDPCPTSAHSAMSPSVAALATNNSRAVCAYSCPSTYFPFMTACVPCDAESVGSFMLASNVTLTADVDIMMSSARPLYCSGASPTAASDEDAILLTVVVIAVFFFVAGVGMGYCLWATLLHSGDDRDLRFAVRTLPVTLLFVDVHSSASKWRADPQSHADFLSDFYQATKVATVKQKAYRVRRVGDGVLLVCHDVVAALNLARKIRQELRNEIDNSLQEKPHRYSHHKYHQAHQAAGDVATPTKRNAPATLPSAVQQQSSRATTPTTILVPEFPMPSQHQVSERLVDSIAFAIHTTSCVDIIRGNSSIDYRGEDAKLPILMMQSLRGGEVALTLDALAALDTEFHNSIAGGAHLRSSAKTQGLRGRVACVNLGAVLDRLHGNHSATKSSSGGGTSGASSGSAAPQVRTRHGNERVCFTGTRVRILKALWIDQDRKKLSSNDEDHRHARALDPQPATATPASPIELQSQQPCSQADPNDVHLVVDDDPLHNTVVSSSSRRGSNAAGFVGHAALHSVDDQYLAYLDEPDLNTNAVTAHEFKAMCDIVVLLLRSAVSSLDERMQQQVTQELQEKFAVTSFDRRCCRQSSKHFFGDDEEEEKLHFFHRLAARVVQCQQPTVAKQCLLNCAAAGITFADIIADSSSVFGRSDGHTSDSSKEQ